MALFFVSLLVIASVIAAMAIGVLAGRAPLKGSCGGIQALGMKGSCDICGGSPERCEEARRPPDGDSGQQGATLYSPASR